MFYKDRKLKGQRGFVGTFDAVILLSVLAFVTTQFFQITTKQDERDRAFASGADLSQYQVGVSKFISYNQYGGTLANPTPLSDYLVSNGHTSEASGITFNGTNWLKKYDLGTCPSGLQGLGLQTSNQSFLPCLFKDRTNLRQTYSTVIWLDTVQARIFGKTTVPGVQWKGGARKDLTSMVANKAATGYSSTSEDSVSTIEFDHVTGNIIATSSNAPSNSTWLRVDGSNTMKADIDVGGYSIVNGLNGTFSDTVTSNDIVANNNLDVTNTITTKDINVTNQAAIKSILLNAGVNLSSASGDLDIVSAIANGVSSLNINKGDLTISNITPLLKFIAQDAAGVKSAKTSQISANAPDEITMSFTKADGTAGTGAFNVDGDIYTSDVNRFSSQSVYDVSIVANMDVIEKPVCPTGRTPQVFLAPSSISVGGTVKPVGAVSTYAEDAGTPAPGGWNVYIEIQDEDGVHGGKANTIPVTFPNTSILAIRKCT